MKVTWIRSCFSGPSAHRSASCYRSGACPGSWSTCRSCSAAGRFRSAASRSGLPRSARSQSTGCFFLGWKRPPSSASCNGASASRCTRTVVGRSRTSPAWAGPSSCSITPDWCFCWWPRSSCHPAPVGTAIIWNSWSGSSHSLSSAALSTEAALWSNPSSRRSPATPGSPPRAWACSAFRSSSAVSWTCSFRCPAHRQYSSSIRYEVLYLFFGGLLNLLLQL